MANLVTKIIRSNRRSISMQMLPDTTIVVKAPLFFPQKEIDKFIDKNSSWIEKKLAILEKNKIQPKKYVEGEEFWYMGDKVKLKFGDYSDIKVEKDFLLFPLHLKFRIQKELEAWYIKQAKLLINELLIKYAVEFNTNYKSVSFSDTRSKWGSCTHDNRLQFSWRLIMAPFLVVRYVVVHELAHTIEKNHSRNFWARVASINPSYRQQIKWLNLNGNSLFV